MSDDSQDFGALRRLLALKRHEQPPPGYFHGFSGDVIARIKAGDLGESRSTGRFIWEAAWLQRLWSALETKPILAGAFGAAVCGLLIWGVIFSEKGDVQPLTTLVQPAPAASDPVLIARELPSDEPLQASPVFVAFSGKNAMSGPSAATESAAGLFDLIPKPKADQAATSFKLKFSGGN